MKLSLLSLLVAAAAFAQTAAPTTDPAAFKAWCEKEHGEFRAEYTTYGIGPLQHPPSCGFNRARDANRLCSAAEGSLEKVEGGPCTTCTYGSSCAPAAGDFGPMQCRCGDYSRVEWFGGKDRAVLSPGPRGKPVRTKTPSAPPPPPQKAK